MRSLYSVLGCAICLAMSGPGIPADAVNPVAAPIAAGAPTTTAPANAPAVKHPVGCLATGNGYLRAQIRGSLKLDIDLHNSELECDGGARPDGSGIRVSFAGPLRSDGRRLRMVFGVGTAAEGTSGRALPTNLTVIFEGEQRLFATRGDDKCTVDELSQERLGALGGPTRSYRVIARGFCIAPVTALHADDKILVSSFDFAGSVTFEDL
jgi:hypothetical protein